MLQFSNDPYECHHFGLRLEREHFAMLEEPPPYVLVPYHLPDPQVWCWEGGRRGMTYSDVGDLLLPVPMETIPHHAVKELQDEFEQEMGDHWNAFASLYGQAYDPIWDYFDVGTDWSDELPYKPVRVQSCWPLESVEQAQAISTATYSAFEGGPWPIIERLCQLGEEYGSAEALLELASRPIPADLPEKKRQYMQAEAEDQLNVAVEFEEIEAMVYDRDGHARIEPEEFLVKLPGELDVIWQRLLINRQRALSALPQLTGMDDWTLRTERMHYSWP